MSRDGTLLFSPRQVFMPLGAACAGGVGVIALLARDRGVAIAAGASFALASVISVLIATVWSGGDDRFAQMRRALAVAALGATAALPGWYFGASSAYAGVLAIILVFSGLLMGGVGTPFPAIAAWMVYIAIAGGQAVVAVLVFTHAIRDASLLPLVPDGAVPWHHVAAHVTVQLVYAAAFGIGRALHRRYWAVSEELDVAMRAAARRDALLDEARAEYRRTFALGREGVFAGHTIGRYRLGGLIGRGGAGEVYDACDVVDGSQVAIKLLRGDRLDDPAEVRGFLEEATALTRIDSPHVVRAHQIGGLDEILPYIAMERLEGMTLAQLIAQHGKLDRDGVRRLADDGGKALEAVHRVGICHGDVNPRNLVLVDGAWKLIDFGAKRASAEHVVGTPRFVAPECLTGAAPGPATDVYGLAACVYTAVTGREPFVEVANTALAHAVITRLPIDPRLAGEAGEVAADLADVLAIALAPADQRFASAAEFRASVGAALSGELDSALRERGRAIEWSTPQADDGEPTATLLDAIGGAPEPPRALVDHSLDAPTSPPSLDVVASTAWRGAFADKMRLQYASVLAACVLGALLIGLIVDDGAMLKFGWATIAVAAAVIGIERVRSREWPWVIVAVLAIGPAYVLGLHCGFAAVIAVTLFVESSFRSSQGGITGRGWILVGVLVSHATVFALIVARVIPDGHVTPILHHTSWWSSVVIEALVLAIFVVAFVLGHRVYARYAELVLRNEGAARDAAGKEAMLASARAEVERVLAGYAGGLFTGSRIGTYEVELLLGRGGMGEVYAARRGDERVALKVIRADRVADAANLKRFAREGETLTRIESPYVARVLEVGTEDGRLPFLVMELVEGISLADQLRGRDRLDVAAVAAMARDVARGLADVHRAGVVHRDVKPHNLVMVHAVMVHAVMVHAVMTGQRWKLVDFGIAKRSGASQTTGQIIVGTPAYMAPEQLAGGPADARSDLYSLCLVLYRALAGRPAFTNLRVAHQPPPDPYRITDVPDDVRHALRIGLAMQPADRFETATELEAAFDAAFAGRLDGRLRTRARVLHARDPWP